MLLSVPKHDSGRLPHLAGSPLLTVPLPFLAGLIFALVLHHSLKGVDAPGSRRYFVAFLVLYALQGLIVGLHFGYGVTGLALVQPITASVMPPLAFLAFRELTGSSSPHPWLHLWAPMAVGMAVAFLRMLIDPLLLVVFLVYSLALWQLTRAGGAEVMAEASLQRMRPALRAARLTAGLMFFFAATDAGLAVHTRFFGVDSVPLVVTAANIAALAAVALYYFWPQPGSALRQATEAQAPDPADEAVVIRASAVLDENGLFRDDNLSLAKIARKAGIPARDLSAAINRATGLNVSQFVNDRRIAEACHLLDATKQSATAIMLDVGFSTKSNFNREFRRVTGMSPRQWRARARATGDAAEPAARRTAT
jgi:AraC-like DNA-binding protein